MNNLPLPNKNARYRFLGSEVSIWKISEAEDFDNGTVTLYDCDMSDWYETYSLKDFYEKFEEIS